MQSRKAFGLIFTLLLFFMACDMPVSPAGDSGESSNNSDDNTPYSTTNWALDTAGFMQYYTDDPAQITENGTSEYYWSDPEETVLSVLEVEMKKISGDALMGYGVIFNVKDENNFMNVVIDTDGWYRVSRVVNGDDHPIVFWTRGYDIDGFYINMGYNVINTVKVTYNEANSKYSLYFNDYYMTDFSDLTPASPGGQTGFIVGISSVEDFPATPVDVRFKRLSPN